MLRYFFMRYYVNKNRSTLFARSLANPIGIIRNTTHLLAAALHFTLNFVVNSIFSWRYCPYIIILSLDVYVRSYPEEFLQKQHKAILFHC